MATYVKRGDKYRAVVRRRGHRTVTRTFNKLADAKRWGHQKDQEIVGVIAAGKHAYVGDLMRKYVEEFEQTRAWERTHKSNMLRFARDMDGFTVNDLTAAKLVPWAKGRKVSPATVAQEIGYLTSMLAVAEALWHTPAPWVEIKRTRTLLRRLGILGKSRKRDRRVRAGEIEAVLAHANTTLPLDDLIAFSIASTMRVSEVTRLLKADLDAETKTVLIRDRKDPQEKKGNDQRVPLLGDAYRIIERQLGRTGEDEPRIFPYVPESIERAYQRARERAGVEGLRWHDLRHEGISRLFEAGFAIQEVAIVSGHKDWNTLKRYTHLSPASLHDGPQSRRVTSTNS